ncbi:MAG: peptidoglycan bridge formation glycyltransferase FemA/FemB family protein [Anaerolineales bacterium]|nr:peptidoglycan bridge formation glycyltransferase FemA/FemB family protein [Anaerolineales bacterium]
MPEVSLAEWQSFLKKQSDVHLLQMGEWGELKSAFGWRPVRLILDDRTGAQILFRRLPFGLTLGYLPKPVVSDKFWNEVDFVCRKYHAIFLKIEPDNWDDSFILHPASRSFILSPYNIQPPRTVIVSIKETEVEILARMKQKTRYNIRLAEKKGVTVRAWDNIAGFHAMMQVTGGRDGFGVHSLDYYRRAYELFHPTGACELLVAEFDGKPLSALMVFAYGRRAWYVYGASNDEERNRMPTYLLQWEAIRWAKARGCEEYDLWGVPDEDEVVLEADFESRHDGLWGVYRFKRGFGGEVKRAAQAMDRVYNPLLYKLYLWRMAGREGG